MEPRGHRSLAVVSPALPMAVVPTEPCLSSDVSMGLGALAELPLDQGSCSLQELQGSGTEPEPLQGAEIKASPRCKQGPKRRSSPRTYCCCSVGSASPWGSKCLTKALVGIPEQSWGDSLMGGWGRQREMG